MAATPSIRDIEPIVVEAGELARGYFRNVAPERKADRTLVTEADRAVETFLAGRISHVAPHARLLGEEHGAAGDASAACTITLDPIDGTSAFVSGLPTWCVTVGVVCNGTAVAGITHLPMTAETYLAEDGTTEWNGRAIVLDRRAPTDSDLFIATHSDLHRSGGIKFPGKVRSLGSTAYHMALVARGAAVAALLGRPRIWDIAAGMAMIAAIGGEVRYVSGPAVELTALLQGERAPEPIIAAAPGVFDDIVAQVRR